MALNINRTGSAQESTISLEDSDCEKNPPARLECPICINWLIFPVLTPCGHKFCQTCILDWLKKPNTTCPVDNKLLTENDLFEDNCTLREISNMRIPCLNSRFGCQVNFSPIDQESHAVVCEYRKHFNNKNDCLFKSYGCQFVGTNKEILDKHIESDLSQHLNLLMTAFTQIKTRDNDMKALEAKNNFWDAPQKNGAPQNSAEYSCNNNDILFEDMCKRIVTLEQQNLERTVIINNLEEQIKHLNMRYSHGTIIWKITQFNSKLEMMSSNSNRRFYSNHAYTSPYGYKFCTRINISPKIRDSLSLYVHLMQSENDYHLDWPFRGRIKLILIHPKDMAKSRHDTIMSNPEILAFHQPTLEISPRGFGFLEYAKIDDLFIDEFVSDDTLTIKIQLNIV